MTKSVYNIITDDTERANLLKNFFASICVDDDGSKPTIERAIPDDANIDTIDFTPIDIATAMKKMQAKNHHDLVASHHVYTSDSFQGFLNRSL